MKSELEGAQNGEFTKPPFLYEIRVKGRLSSEQWTSWFDDLSVTTARGETTLRGKAPDHAALYALLARLRDLAIPLVAVKVLDAEAQRKLYQSSRRYDLLVNGLVVAAYLLLLGGLSAVTVFVAQAINVALALVLLFAALGGLAHVFGLWTGQKAWRWAAYLGWLAAVIAFLVFIPLSGLMPPALGIGVMLLLATGAVIYTVNELKRGVENVRTAIVEEGRPAGPGAPAGGAAPDAHHGNA